MHDGCFSGNRQKSQGSFLLIFPRYYKDVGKQNHRHKRGWLAQFITLRADAETASKINGLDQAISKKEKFQKIRDVRDDENIEEVNEKEDEEGGDDTGALSERTSCSQQGCTPSLIKKCRTRYGDPKIHTLEAPQKQ
jgi:hypothetical protein